jgi:DNA-binding beta-propeller fold protein YncE
MKTKLSYVIVAIMVLTLASLACKAVTGIFDDEPQSEEVIAPQEESESQPAGEPQGAAEDSSLGELYRSEEGGFSFEVIPDYVVEEFFGLVTMEAPNADPDFGPLILLMGGINDEDKTLDQVYDEFSEDVATDEDAQVEISNKRDVKIGGVDGYQADLEGIIEGQNVAGRVAFAMPSATQQFTMSGFAPEDQWESLSPLFDTVLATVQFFEPTEVEIDFDDDAGFFIDETRQWASSAVASSEWGNPDWSAMQATGAPDTIIEECEDATTAWASAGSDTVEWIELSYDIPVTPTEINIIQTHSPDQVVLVEVVDLGGEYHSVYTGTPENLWELCPYTLSISLDVDFEVDTVKITVDQSVIGATWNEIDAVELVGHEVSLDISPPPSDAGTTEGFLWRAGGERGSEEGQIGGVDGMDATAEGRLYIADETFGVRILDASDGSLINLIDHEDLWQPSDLQVAPDGTIFVGDWGSNQVFGFSPQGKLLVRFGEDGNGPGQFGTFSPVALAVSPDGEIYVLDDNETDAEEDFTRVQVFDSQGNFLREFQIDAEYSGTEEMDFGPNGNLYIVDWLEDAILEYTPDGTLAGTLGEEALSWAGPQDIAIDDAGNFYITVWTPDSVMKLDPQGNLLAQFGVDVEDGENAWMEGEFYSISGVAVLPDGSRVFASDWSSYYAYITAFEFK